MARIEASQITQERHSLDWLGPRIVRVAGTVGVGALLASLVLATVTPDGLRRFLHAYLVSYVFFLSLSLGALFFVALQHVTRSGWSVVVRRLAELLAGNLLLLALLFLPIVVGMTHLFQWASHEELAGHQALPPGKAPYLNVPFWILRCVLYFAVWCGLARWFLKWSVEQDASGDVLLTRRMERLSAPALVLYALTVTFAAFDILMTLDAHWYSTIFGVYVFAGGAVGFFALLTVLTAVLQRTGRLVRAITTEHYHDLGKLLFAFVFFWAYIAFSQYMLIWYGNIPEETTWYLRRQVGSWKWLGLALLFGHFLLPFAGLLSRRVKRNRRMLIVWAVWLLIMHWLDVFWLVMPELARTSPSLSPERIPFHAMDVGCLVALSGLFLAGLAWLARGRALVPLKDPRLDESLSFENA